MNPDYQSLFSNDNILWLFDIDNTLLISEKEKELQVMFYDFINYQFITPMHDLFCFLRGRIPNNVGILTSRPPGCRSAIERIFKTTHIITNNYSFPSKEIAIIQLADVNKFKKQNQLRKMRKLKDLTETFDRIIFFDDEYQDYQNMPLNPKISVLSPIYNEETAKNIMKMIILAK